MRHDLQWPAVLPNFIFIQLFIFYIISVCPGLVRWLSSQGHWLLLQRILVEFQAPSTIVEWQFTIAIWIPGYLMDSSSLCGNCTQLVHKQFLGSANVLLAGVSLLPPRVINLVFLNLHNSNLLDQRKPVLQVVNMWGFCGYSYLTSFWWW